MIDAEEVLAAARQRIRDRWGDQRMPGDAEISLVEALVDEINAEIERQIGAVLERVETMLATKADRVRVPGRLGGDE